MENETARTNVVQQAQEIALDAVRPLREGLARSDAGADGRTLGVALRACQGYFAAVLFGALAYALVTAPADFAYDFSLVHGFATAALACICVWLFQKRASSARHFAVGTFAACTVLSATDMFALGAFDVVASRFGPQFTLAALAAQYSLGLMACAYLLTSARAKRVLSRQLDRRPLATTGHSWDLPLKQRVRTWVFWRDILIYFMAFSFMGHWAEMLFCYNIHTGLFMGDVDFSEVMLWKQWLFPYTAEGVAVVAIAVVLTPVKEWLLRRFNGRLLPAVLASVAVTAVVCTTIDFTCGMICNRNYEVWDYRALPFNFMGQICLQNSTVYTVAASLILWIFYPMMDRGLRRMPRSAADGLFFALLGIYAFSALLHFMYVGDAGLVVGDFEM